MEPVAGHSATSSPSEQASQIFDVTMGTVRIADGNRPHVLGQKLDVRVRLVRG
jgi:hypothetical protein